MHSVSSFGKYDTQGRVAKEGSVLGAEEIVWQGAVSKELMINLLVLVLTLTFLLVI